MTPSMIPAFGRDYETATQIIAAWEDGKDFRLADITSPYDGKMCSIRDFIGETVKLRYRRLTRVHVYEFNHK